MVKPKQKFKGNQLVHTFDMDTTKFVCKEELYVSDRTTETGYPLEHRHNRGKSQFLPFRVFSSITPS